MNRPSRHIVLLYIVVASTFAFASAALVNKTAIIGKRAVYHSTGLGQPTIIQRSRASRPSLQEYTTLRNNLVKTEESRILGSSIVLSNDEKIANGTIMAAKNAEYEEGLKNPYLFNPSQHIFSVLERISKSELFGFLKAMPKGGVLHAHDTALCSTDYIVSLTYKEDLWYCSDSNGDAKGFRFSKEKPSTQSGCKWELTAKVREERGAENFDSYLKSILTLYPTEKFKDNNAAWASFMEIFGVVDGLLLYAPVWGEYYYQALTEFYADGVMYMEFRTTLPLLYDMVGTTYTPMDTVRIYYDTLQSFKAANPGFIGSKMIYAPVRHVDSIEDYIRIAIDVKERYPDYFAGFDLVGQEELGRPLIDFLPEILDIPDDINFYFHAGETNWYGSTVDENLFDAVLLGTKRIGHGNALVKHPAVLDMLRERDIAVEVNPISNQVLQLVADLRNHPCSHFFANNYTVVISSDDPSFWRATPLSHDFYVAFLGIASAHADLRLLKKLAINSIEYSSLNETEKESAMEKWTARWNDYVQSFKSGAAGMST